MATLPASETPRARRFVRHWKERFRKGMPLVFTKRVRLDANRTFEAGAAVPDDVRKELGEHRLRLWWEARVVGSATAAIAVGLKPAPTPPAPAAEDPSPECGIKLGDDKTLQDAKTKFDAKPNFGGFPRKEGGKGKKN